MLIPRKLYIPDKRQLRGVSLGLAGGRDHGCKGHNSCNGYSGCNDYNMGLAGGTIATLVAMFTVDTMMNMSLQGRTGVVKQAAGAEYEEEDVTQLSAQRHAANCSRVCRSVFTVRMLALVKADPCHIQTRCDWHQHSGTKQK
eukprot:scaffold224618_cov19-Tisochrysis_lutea.AAC.1